METQFWWAELKPVLYWLHCVKAQALWFTADDTEPHLRIYMTNIFKLPVYDLEFARRTTPSTRDQSSELVNFDSKKASTPPIWTNQSAGGKIGASLACAAFVKTTHDSASALKYFFINISSNLHLLFTNANVLERSLLCQFTWAVHFWCYLWDNLLAHFWALIKLLT